MSNNQNYFREFLVDKWELENQITIDDIVSYKLKTHLFTYKYCVLTDTFTITKGNLTSLTVVKASDKDEVSSRNDMKSLMSSIATTFEKTFNVMNSNSVDCLIGNFARLFQQYYVEQFKEKERVHAQERQAFIKKLDASNCK